MYVISSGEDGVLLLEQAANAKQSKEIIFFIGSLQVVKFQRILLNQKLFCYLFLGYAFLILVLEIKKWGENYSLNLYVGARFLTRALGIKARWVFKVFFSEIRHTLGSVRHQGGQIKKDSASVHAGAV